MHLSKLRLGVVGVACAMVVGMAASPAWGQAGFAFARVVEKGVSPGDASIMVFNTFEAYDAAVGGNHTLFFDFETDKFGGTVIPSENDDGNNFFDIEGDTFSFDVTYSSPDFPSSRVNIANIGGVVQNEIGPFNEWDGIVRWEYSGDYVATAFTAISVKPITVLRLFDNGMLIGSIQVGGTGQTFQFFGFTSTDAFDAVELDGIFFAIDAHYSTAVPAPASLDIKPGSCPNSFNRNSHGVLPVALVGSDNFDALDVDLSTVLLSRADGLGGSVAPNEGPPGPHSVFADVATPFDGEPCGCHELAGDGIDDLSMKFKSQEVVAALELNDLPPGAPVELCVSGELLDGTEFEACDCVILVPPGDMDGDGLVGVADLLRLLAQWGPCGLDGECSADYNGDTMVGVVDLLIMLGNWS